MISRICDLTVYRVQTAVAGERICLQRSLSPKITT